jgi:nucleoid DNA-binding protein
MAEALQRGETVQIQGFGTFKLKTYKPKVQSVALFYGKQKLSLRDKIILPERKKVVFVPSGALRKFVDQGAEDSGN